MRVCRHSRTAVTPEIQTKADELTKGLTGQTEKEHALYNFVSTQFRYVSLSFGTGRYQPHAAAEVLANGYGDCKDKHTLLAALLKAEGIEAWPALIGAGLKFDETLPSPAQFNHVITYLPSGKDEHWLDATSGVAPFGLIEASIRDKKALVIPATEAPRLLTTPENPPFPTEQQLRVTGELKPDGTFTGRFEVTAHGDVEMVIRSLFQQVPPANWRELVQNMVRGAGFAGTVSNLDVDNVRDLDKPVHYAYDYTRPNYSDWANRRISPPLFPLLFAPAEGQEAPEEPFFLGAAGTAISEATIKLPAGYSTELPENSALHTEFADYLSTYELKNGTLFVHRKLIIKQSKIPVDQWKKYCDFAKTVSSDHDKLLQLAASSDDAKTPPSGENQEAARLIEGAMKAGQRNDLNAAHDLLSRAERLNAKQPGLWMAYALVYFHQLQEQSGFDALDKELRYHPDNVAAYRLLAAAQVQFKKLNEAVDTLRRLLKVAPGDKDGVKMLADLLNRQKRYEEVIALLEPLAGTPGAGNSFQGQLGEAYLRTGRKREGQAALASFVSNSDPLAFNNAAFFLADTRTDLASAQEYATKAVSALEQKSKKIQLFDLSNDDLRLMNDLATVWDTVGWVYFETGNLPEAHKYLSAAWNLGQRRRDCRSSGPSLCRRGP